MFCEDYLAVVHFQFLVESVRLGEPFEELRFAQENRRVTETRETEGQTGNVQMFVTVRRKSMKKKSCLNIQIIWIIQENEIISDGKVSEIISSLNKNC